MEEKNLSMVSTPVAILIGSIIIALSIMISGGAIKIKGFNQGNTLGAQAVPQTSSPPVPAAALPEEDTGPVKVSLDDDPIIGDKNAPVTIVEFSDYECPFCKRHYDQTHLKLKKDYIDTGKVKLVFRDLPLSFHEPMATIEAIAANCAREQGGDEAYFKYHDELFKRTTSNGNGLDKDDLEKIATDLGLNSANLKSCVDDEKYKAEVESDSSEGATYGASGTPTFFIGKSSTGKEIEGTKIVGAQPYSVFQSTIDPLLK